MKFVNIYKLDDEGNQENLAKCIFSENKVIISGNEATVNFLNERGIIDYFGDKDKKLFPSDGLKFLENLKYNFKSGYINATDILEI